ncbi:zinc ribbon domain-containing protein [Levilactobacillus wangkuiensis]|uniref:zinc ribbon domain-containing protein n=1 Tax=Levilactobacillus wangkuiensis TaxID=2799566 RepID=UPI001941CDA7|nr:zinc ribbon domain-containing protein [Levilactobacillus wangkuiensis]
MDNPKFCPNCGNPLSGTAQFCPKCGYQLGSVASAHNEAPQEPVTPDSVPTQDTPKENFTGNFFSWWRDALRQPTLAPINANHFFGIGFLLINLVLTTMIAYLIANHFIFMSIAQYSTKVRAMMPAGEIHRKLAFGLFLIALFIYALFLIVAYVVRQLGDAQAPRNFLEFTNHFATSASSLVIANVALLIIAVFVNFTTTLKSSDSYTVTDKKFERIILFMVALVVITILMLSLQYFTTTIDIVAPRLDKIYLLIIATAVTVIGLVFIGKYAYHSGLNFFKYLSHLLEKFYY